MTFPAFFLCVLKETMLMGILYFFTILISYNRLTGIASCGSLVLNTFIVW